jgi:uncharacterized protein (DUF924 family)
MDKRFLDDIHRYWFGALKSPTDVVPQEQMTKWFRSTVEIDNHIRDAFGRYLEAAKDTEWDLPNLAREEQVALVILLDQFPRNIFRSSAEAFAFDTFARDFARRLIAGGLKRFFLAERSFLGLPFEHSEDIADQDYSVFLMAQLALDAPDDQKDRYRGDVDFATRHRDVIRKFGRFPHRNALLGRVSTAEEIEFLKSGRGF